ncbi:MAG TPA: hypothetical protein VGQ71_04010, partial [Terriglobales bacterium]|nr:hypothetical protein [Terriglobales bacterium]
IFVGGSNLIFGLRAGPLSRRIGAPVVNYGLHAGIGIDVIAARASDLIGPGDLVVLATEALHDPLAQFHSPLRAKFLNYVAGKRPLYSLALARKSCASLRQTLHNRVMSLNRHRPSSANEPTSVYSLEAIGLDGSLYFPRPVAGNLFVSRITGGWTDADLARSTATRALELLREKCRQRRATLAVMPPFRLAAPGADLSLLLECERRWLALAGERGAIQLLGPGESLLEPHFGFDSEYHLNDAGVAIMETRLAGALTSVLAGPESGASIP